MELGCAKRTSRIQHLRIITTLDNNNNNEELSGRVVPNSSLLRTPVLFRVPHNATFFNLIRCNTNNTEHSPVCDFDFFELSIFSDSNNFKQSPSNKSVEDYSELLKICEKNEFEIIETLAQEYKGELFLAILRIRAAIIESSSYIIRLKTFRYFVFNVILVNTVFLALEDPTNSDDYSNLQIFFIIVYTVEFYLKIFSNGVFLEKKSYFRKKWNILDFIVLLTFWLDFVKSSGLNLQVLRALRVLRPLKSISSLKGLRLIVISVGTSVRPLLAAMSLFLLLIFIFAIAGIQMWSGLFYYKCLDLHTGFITGTNCGSFECPTDYMCAKSLSNPNLGITSFDNIFFASLTVYQCITLEGWIKIMNLTEHTFSSLALIYFLPLVFFGALIFLNLFMVIIKSALSKTILKGLRFKKSGSELVDSKILSDQYSEDVGLECITPKNAGFSNRTRFSPIRSYMPSIMIQASGDSLMENEIQNENFPFNSDLTYKKKIVLFHEDIQQLDAYIKSNTPQLSSIFDKMNTKIPVTTTALEKIARGDKLLKTKVLIIDFNYESTSSIDVKPINRELSAENFINMPTRTFIYKDPTEMIENPIRCWEFSKETLVESLPGYLSDYQIFSKLASKYNYETAFELINYPVSSFYKRLLNIENQTNYIEGIWSGSDVSIIRDLIIIDNMNRMDYKIWSSNFLGLIEKCRFPLKKIIESKKFNIFIILCVILNTLVLSIDHYGITTEALNILLSINLAFTLIFICEMFIKIVALGPKMYLKDSMNYFDGSIVILSIVELAFTSGTKSVISAFRTARVFRIFKVLRILRIAKIFRYLRSMAHIIVVIGKSVSKYMYIGLLLFILIMIYSILGMQIFGGKFQTDEKTRTNFDTFHWSFITNFQILTLENWQNILYTAMSSTAGYASCLYFLSWIFLGNYIILNLFLASLLENFSESNVEEAVKDRKEMIFGGHAARMTKKIEKKMRMVQEMNSDSDDDTENMSSMKFSILADTSKSLYLFDLNSKIRQMFISITCSQKFEYFILFIILLSSIKLALDTYLSPNLVDKLELVDHIFSSIFILEFLLKIISRGFIMCPSSYLRDSWNYIDFVVVISSIVDFSISSNNLTHIKVVRILRTLRPFRYINYNYSMKIVLISLLQSIVAILNVIIVQIVILLMFAILGVSLFAGKLYVCSNQEFDTRLQCELAGYAWQAIWPNFDNIWNTFVTLMILSSMEGWPDIMYTAVDATDVDQGPEFNSNPYVSYYFIVFITISSFFFMNLFIGVIYEKFNEARKTETSLAASILTKDQMLWIEIQKFILKSSPTVDRMESTKNGLKKICYVINESTYFEVVVAIMIVLNMLLMSFYYEGANDQLIFALDTCNLVFSALFTLEAFIKILALGLSVYLKSFSNIFDLIVILISCIDIFLTYIMGSKIKLLRRGPQMIRIVKVLRISKIIRLFKILKPLKKFVDIIIYSLPAFGNIMALLILIFFIYAIIGFQLFGDLSSGYFSNFSVAMLTLFRCSTGEDWPSIMFDCGKANGMFVAQLYFLTFITLVVFIILNLFVMVIIQNYEDYDKNPETVECVFVQSLIPIRRVWNEYSTNEDGARVHIQHVVEMMKNLNDFGINYLTPQEKIIRLLRSLHIEGDKEGYIYYHNFLFAIFRKKFLQKSSGKHIRKITRNEEKNTKKKITEITLREQKKFAKRKNSDVAGSASVQNFMEKVYMKTLLRGWRHYVKIKIEKRKMGACIMSITPRESEHDFPGDNTLIIES